jgi:hypothetical protein
VDGMKLKDPHKKNKTLITLAIISVAVTAILFYKNKK